MQKQYENTIDALIAYQDMMYGSAPFMPEKRYNKYYELYKLFQAQLSDFEDFRMRPDADDWVRECKNEERDSYKRTTEIDNKFRELNKELREYLENLEVIQNM